MNFPVAGSPLENDRDDFNFLGKAADGVGIQIINFPVRFFSIQIAAILNLEVGTGSAFWRKAGNGEIVDIAEPELDAQMGRLDGRNFDP